MKSVEQHPRTSVTIKIPREAGESLKRLATFNMQLLERLGILAIQVDDLEPFHASARSHDQVLHVLPQVPSGGNLYSCTAKPRQDCTRLPETSAGSKRVDVKQNGNILTLPCREEAFGSLGGTWKPNEDTRSCQRSTLNCRSMEFPTEPKFQNFNYISSCSTNAFSPHPLYMMRPALPTTTQFCVRPLLGTAMPERPVQPVIQWNGNLLHNYSTNGSNFQTVKNSEVGVKQGKVKRCRQRKNTMGNSLSAPRSVKECSFGSEVCFPDVLFNGFDEVPFSNRLVVANKDGKAKKNDLRNVDNYNFPYAINSARETGSTVKTDTKIQDLFENRTGSDIITKCQIGIVSEKLKHFDNIFSDSTAVQPSDEVLQNSCSSSKVNKPKRSKRSSVDEKVRRPGGKRKKAVHAVESDLLASDTMKQHPSSLLSSHLQLDANIGCFVVMPTFAAEELAAHSSTTQSVETEMIDGNIRNVELSKQHLQEVTKSDTNFGCNGCIGSSLTALARHNQIVVTGDGEQTIIKKEMNAEDQINKSAGQRDLSSREHEMCSLDVDQKELEMSMGSDIGVSNTEARRSFCDEESSCLEICAETKVGNCLEMAMNDERKSEDHEMHLNSCDEILDQNCKTSAVEEETGNVETCIGNDDEQSDKTEPEKNELDVEKSSEKVVTPSDIICRESGFESLNTCFKESLDKGVELSDKLCESAVIDDEKQNELEGFEIVQSELLVLSSDENLNLHAVDSVAGIEDGEVCVSSESGLGLDGDQLLPLSISIVDLVTRDETERNLLSTIDSASLDGAVGNMSSVSAVDLAGCEDAADKTEICFLISAEKFEDESECDIARLTGTLESVSHGLQEGLHEGEFFTVAEEEPVLMTAEVSLGGQPIVPSDSSLINILSNTVVSASELVDMSESNIVAAAQPENITESIVVDDSSVIDSLPVESVESGVFESVVDCKSVIQDKNVLTRECSFKHTPMTESGNNFHVVGDGGSPGGRVDADLVHPDWSGLSDDDIKVIRLNNEYPTIDRPDNKVFENITKRTRSSIPDLGRFNALVCEFDSVVINSSSLFCVTKVMGDAKSDVRGHRLKFLVKKSKSAQSRRRWCSLPNTRTRHRLNRKLVGGAVVSSRSGRRLR